jgi:hypothetical protein
MTRPSAVIGSFNAEKDGKVKNKETEFQIKLNHTQSCLLKLTKELLDCVAKINTDNFNTVIIKVMKCLTKQIDYDTFKFKWIDLSTIEIKKDKNQEVYLRYTTLLKDFRYKENSNEDYNRMRGWYFFVNRALGSIDYIGVSGTIDGELNDYNDLYHRISQHFGTSTGATFCRNCYRGDTIPNREKWINTLKQNYDIMVIYTKEGNIKEDSLYVVESFLVGVFQPKCNRQ